MECIPQNKDCTVHAVMKAASVLNVASKGKLAKLSESVQTGFKCGMQLISAVKKINATASASGTGAGATNEQITVNLKKSDAVQYDLPAAVATCMNRSVADGLANSKAVAEVADKIFNLVVSSKGKGIKLNDLTSLMTTIISTVPGAAPLIDLLSKGDKSSLMSLANSADTCYVDLNSVMNKIISMVLSLRATDPTISVDAIRFAVLNSDAVMKDLPKVARACATAAKGFSGRDVATTGFPVRDNVIKLGHMMIDNIIESSSKDGNPLSRTDYAIALSNIGLEALSTKDSSGILAMAAEFVQPACGPTVYIGDIDDGPADQALGLNTIDKAFGGSTGTWSKKGDGLLKITFKSVDDKDVRVNIKSGGQKLYEVAVKKGQTVQWSKPLSEFQGKTLYLDRSRPVMWGISCTKGGSLLAWVPNSKDGSLILNVQLNPTSVFDWGRRLRG